MQLVESMGAALVEIKGVAIAVFASGMRVFASEHQFLLADCE